MRRMLHLGLIATTLIAAAPAGADRSAERSRARAEALAGWRYRPIYDSQCKAGADKKAYIAAALADTAPIVPRRMFDNLYVVGTRFVVSYLVDTPDGIIAIDALGSEADAKALVVGGMRTLGLDPMRLRYIVLTHGHFDHAGGAHYLAGLTGARVLAAPAEWALMAKPQAGLPGFTPPAHDIDIVDGQALTLGGTTLRLYVTPGHTDGTVSLLLPVRDRGRPHLLGLWGGSSARETPEGLATYSASLHRFRAIERRAGADGILASHIYLMPHGNRDAVDGATGVNPVVTGRKGADRYRAVHALCLDWNFRRSTAGQAS